MLVEDRSIIYSSPPHKRKIGRITAIVCSLILILVLWSTAESYQRRKAKGYDPLPPSSVVIFVAPLILVGVGLWIGWGHTRINFPRGTVERRLFGLPWPRKKMSFGNAKQLHVGYFRATKMISTPNSGTIYIGAGKGLPLWFVRLEGEKNHMMIIRQRSFKEATEFARSLGERTEVPVKYDKEPDD